MDRIKQNTHDKSHCKEFISNKTKKIEKRSGRKKSIQAMLFLRNRTGQTTANINAGQNKIVRSAERPQRKSKQKQTNGTNQPENDEE